MSSTAVPGGDNGPATIVLVEDDAGDAVLVEELLRDHGDEFRLRWVRSLTEALGAIGPSTDCVLLDLGLPDAADLDALRTIVDMESGPAVVVLTGFDDRASGARALALGAQDYLSKDGVDEESLARSLRYAIARQQGEESVRRLREAERARSENARLERGLLPRPLIINDRLAWATRYEPGGRRALLGGDFFDAVELEDGRVRIVVGDVCGHGPDEAALGVALRVAWRTLVLAGQPAPEALAAMERLLEVERISDEVFVTLCDLEIEPGLGRVQVRLGGHPSPLLFDGTDVKEIPVETRSPLMGGLEKGRWAATPVELDGQWTLLAFTDGLIEGRNGSDQGSGRLDVEGLVELAGRAFAEGNDLDSVADLLINAVEDANGAPLHDDVALVLLSTASRWQR
ncbi:MAG TPA: SpoIIE family protein phosphatase [Acidimicrobiales bacterium]|jgi:serine phosphatase RsbU (regulator of sigma subunit)|nr:SpoIIE family protein phosphatase [Acidimicrobiales bacterium]